MTTRNENEAQEAWADALGSELGLGTIKYRDLLEGVGAAIFALNLEGRFVFVNGQALELLGYQPHETAELVGQHFTKILDPDQIPLASELFQQGEGVRPLVISAKRKDGTPVSVEVSGAWVRRRGKRVGALAMAWALTGAVARRPETAHALSKLDMTILQLVSSGLSNREIAERVYLSTHTIKDRIEKLMRLFGVNRRAELAATAARQGLV